MEVILFLVQQLQVHLQVLLLPQAAVLEDQTIIHIVPVKMGDQVEGETPYQGV
jgi:hypothetical protein